MAYGVWYFLLSDQAEAAYVLSRRKRHSSNYSRLNDDRGRKVRSAIAVLDRLSIDVVLSSSNIILKMKATRIFFYRSLDRFSPLPRVDAFESAHGNIEGFVGQVRFADR